MGTAPPTCSECMLVLSDEECFSDGAGALYCSDCWEERRFRLKNDPVSALLSLHGRPIAPAPPLSPINLSPDSREMVLLAVTRDEGPFIRIGKFFSVNGDRWFGTVIASPFALYLLKKDRATGRLYDLLISAPQTSGSREATCSVYDLPLVLKAQLDPHAKWPAKLVLIIPADAVSLVKAPPLRNLLKLVVGNDTFHVYTGAFSFGRKARALARLGWHLNTPLTPTVEAIHNLRTLPDPPAADQWPFVNLLLVMVVGVGTLVTLGLVALVILAIVGHFLGW